MTVAIAVKLPLSRKDKLMNMITVVQVREKPRIYHKLHKLWSE